jgi:hypothetical protein
MPAVLSDLINSKKFLFTLAVTLSVLVAGHFGALSKVEVLSLLGVLWPVYLGAQGVADVGQKIANGHVVRGEILAKNDAVRYENVTSLVSGLMPAIMRALETQGGALTAASSEPEPLRALPKGSPVISLKFGPTEPGEVLEDVPELAMADAAKKTVSCQFKGDKTLCERLDLVLIPPGTVLPSSETKATEAPAVKKSS